jgi:hypothetical protein
MRTVLFGLILAACSPTGGCPDIPLLKQDGGQCDQPQASPHPEPYSFVSGPLVPLPGNNLVEVSSLPACPPNNRNATTADFAAPDGGTGLDPGLCDRYCDDPYLGVYPGTPPQGEVLGCEALPLCRNSDTKGASLFVLCHRSALPPGPWGCRYPDVGC